MDYTYGDVLNYCHLHSQPIFINCLLCWILGTKTICWGFPGDSLVRILLANAGDRSSIPCPGRSHRLWSNSAHVPQLLSPCSRAHALQEKPLQWEACALQLESILHSLQLENACGEAKLKIKMKMLKKRNHLPSWTSRTVMINSRCQLDWHAQIKYYLWVCVRMFPNEISVWIDEL